VNPVPSTKSTVPVPLSWTFGPGGASRLLSEPDLIVTFDRQVPCI
jgi:hypothetical protein